MPDRTTIPGSKLTGYAADEEERRRRRLHGDAYNNFRKEAAQRIRTRHDYGVRNRIWDDEKGKAISRIEAIEKEKEELELKVQVIDEAREKYNEGNVVVCSEQADRDRKDRYEAYLRLEVDELDG